MANTVTVPGGSSTVSVPPSSGGAPAPSSSWTTRYDLDFTTQSWDAKAAGDNATHTMGGVVWEVRHTGNASQILVDSDGLKITPTGGDLWAGNWTAPRIFARLANLSDPVYANAGQGQAVAVQIVVESSQDVTADYDGYGLALLDHFANSVSITGRVHAGAAENRYDLYQSGGYEDQVAGAQLKFYEFVFCNGAVFCNASADTTLQDPMTVTTFRSAGSTLIDRNVDPSTNIIKPDNMLFFLFAFRAGGSSTSFTPTFKKFRVLTLGQEGAI